MNKAKRLLITLIVLCLLGSSVSYANGKNDVESNVQLVGEDVVERINFIDSDGLLVTMTRTSKPDNTYILETKKDGRVVKRTTGEINYRTAYSFLPSKYQSIQPRYIERYLGTASRVGYIGPEYTTASELASAIADVSPSLKLQAAAQVASLIFGMYSSPIPLWVKQVTDSYEVHGDGNTGFLGYYHMYDSYYYYTSSDTTGSNYITVERTDRYNTMPGV